MTKKRKIKDIALILPIGGIVVFLPPYIQIFDQNVSLGGVPLLHLSLFALWLGGIVLTGVVARRLVGDPNAAQSDLTKKPENGEPHASRRTETAASLKQRP